MSVTLRCLVVFALLSTTAWAQTEAPATVASSDVRLRRAAISFGAATAALLQNPDLSRAEQLVSEGKYQEAYDLLAPIKAANTTNPEFTYLLGRATLGTDHPDEARELFVRALRLRPDWVDAHLGLGRAYVKLEDYTAAKIEFETILRFENLPPDLLTQVQIYDEAAEQYLDKGRHLVGFAYLVAGVGRYWENPTANIDESDSDDRRDTFYNARGGFGVNYELPNSYALNADLDYRFRYYNNHEIRNGSDWRWFAAISRNVGQSNLELGFQGRVSYVGNSQYRNDYGILGNWKIRVAEESVNQFSLGAHVRRRSYPSGPLRDRSRNIGDMTAGWTRSFLGGLSSLALNATGGYEWATRREDGNSGFFGADGTLNFVISNRLDPFVSANWQHHSFSDENNVEFDPAYDRIGIYGRRDDIYDFGGGLTWTFANKWSLRPEVLYTRTKSNIVTNEYSSTQLWVNLRKDF